MRSNPVHKNQCQCGNNFITQLLNTPDILKCLNKFFHREKLKYKINLVSCANKYRENYFKISTLPPAASMADFAFSLIAFTLKSNLVFISPLPKIFTLSDLLTRPLLYRFSRLISENSYLSASASIWPILKTLYSIRLLFLKPRLGKRR